MKVGEEGRRIYYVSPIKRHFQQVDVSSSFVIFECDAKAQKAIDSDQHDTGLVNTTF